ncbi:MAG: terpene cyclase/mutase family protein [Gammaproteobacteria bacterium]|nr:terpene cyclase/mutase family protein [Gammaproteobacteria bacterium]
MSKAIKILSLFFIFSAAFNISAADSNMDSALKDRAKRATDNGLRFLREQQAKDGSWSGSVGITALALRAFLESRRKYTEDDGPFITRPVNFLLSHIQPDGSISESINNRNYNTAVAITALKATGNPDYDKIILNGQKFIQGLQLSEQKGYAADHKFYGGIGYGGDERPDLSNAYLAIEALKASSLDSNDPVWEKALVFVSRSQNNSETNDLNWAKNDGGFAYMPGYSPHGDAVSYGSMTHAGLISLLFAGIDKKDPRVQASYKWILDHYTLEKNPGAKHNQGLFYYYNAFAKSMKAYGEDEITDSNGILHNWRNDLSRKLLELQSKDGSWVNSDSPRWWEGNKHLVTAWSVISLNLVIK